LPLLLVLLVRVRRESILPSELFLSLLLPLLLSLLLPKGVNECFTLIFIFTTL
jgi:hypothetical protein